MADDRAERAGERYQVVTDGAGNVVGHGAAGGGAGDGPQAWLAPLPGQTVHDLVLPPATRRRTPQALQRMVERGEWRRYVSGARPHEGPQGAAGAP